MGVSEIKCTFDDCYQRFSSVEAMKKHKAKMAIKVDGIHDFYCKKCDQDSSDDLDYLIHQIESQKHIACPVCGREFQSEGGRSIHVQTDHRQAQNLSCPGCKERFTSAASLIGHIETNKCKIIKGEDFHKHKAEIELEKEAVEEQLSGGLYQLDLLSQSNSNPDYLGGTSLADDERVHQPESWHSTVTHNTDLLQSDRQNSMISWNNEKYPPLVAQKEPSQIGRRQYNAEQNSDDERDGGESDLLGSKWAPHKQKPAWSTQTFSQSVGAQSLRQTRTGSSNLFGSMVDDEGSVATSAATRGTHTADLSEPSNALPPAARAENQDPNAPNAQVQIRQRISLPPRYNLENYWNSVMGHYVCPAYKCGRKLRSIKDFEVHLLSGAHAAARVKCPCCLKSFKSTQALVAHAESGSRKCDLRNTENFDLTIREITGGLLKVEGHFENLGNARFESVPVEEWNSNVW